MTNKMILFAPCLCSMNNPCLASAITPLLRTLSLLGKTAGLTVLNLPVCHTNSRRLISLWGALVCMTF